MIKFLPIEMVVSYHDQLIDQYGGLKGIRDMGLLLSALAMPKSSMFGVDLHPTSFNKAAAYLFHIVCNHPFNDGNKRTGGFCALVFLELNGIKLIFEDDEYEKLVLKVAQNDCNKDLIASFFREHNHPT